MYASQTESRFTAVSPLWKPAWSARQYATHSATGCGPCGATALSNRWIAYFGSVPTPKRFAHRLPPCSPFGPTSL